MDRISTLSDELLLKILSSRPTRDVLPTMLLSKRWKYLWTMVPTLDFRNGVESSNDFIDDDYAKFRQHVYLFMALHKSPVLETLKLRPGRNSNTEDISTWIRIAMSRRVRILKIHRCANHLFPPSCLYTYKNLEVLKLRTSIVLDVPEVVCLPSLKTLHLMCMVESARRLLSGCPVLEELVLEKSGNVSPPCFYVEVPSLKKLTIFDSFDGENDSDVKIVIKTPALKYLNVVDTYDSGLLFLSENMMPEMVVANVNVVYKNPEMLLRSFTSVKRLSLCLNTTMVQHRIEFNQLLHLELCSSVEKWCGLLNWMLESSPKLKVLKLNKCNAHRFAYAKKIEFPWGTPRVPECLKYHLNTFEWNYYNGGREEKKMVAYILRHAKLLKTAKISMWDLDCEAEPHIFKEWRSCPMASKSCQLLSEHEPISD